MTSILTQSFLRIIHVAALLTACFKSKRIPHDIVARIQPLSAGAKLKCRDSVLGKGEKHSFIALPGKGGPQQAYAFKTVPPIGKNCEEFYSRKEKNRFSDRNQHWDKHAFVFLCGSLSHQSWSQEILV